MGCRRYVRASFEWKISKIWQDIAELWPMTNRRLRDSMENYIGRVRSIRALFEQKMSKIRREITELLPNVQWEVT